MPYEVVFADPVQAHLRWLTARENAIVLTAIQVQLVHEPLVRTRRRKPLRPNPVAPWELRVGNLRVFYDVVDHPRDTVRIVAVGRKRGNVLSIAGKEILL